MPGGKPSYFAQKFNTWDWLGSIGVLLAAGGAVWLFFESHFDHIATKIGNVEARMADLDEKLQIQISGVGNKVDGLSSGFTEHRDAVQALVKEAMVERTGQIAESLLSGLDAHQFYTVKLANVPLKSAAYTRIIEFAKAAEGFDVTTSAFGDKGIVEVEFSEVDNARVLDLQGILELTKGEGIQTQISVGFR